ncbi:MAG: ABC transporter substrate binding protein [Thermodesulfobacteriota bacterium]|nr:ABC transporter substrate binding protein [Thermodesulfobacteriota bacterium]
MKDFKSIWLLSFLLLFPSIPSADNKPKILLINSNTSVEKYKVVQEEFKKVVSHSVLEVNLNEKKWKTPHIEDLIYDEDPDLIYCIGSKAYLIAHRYAPRKAIIFSSIINWLRLPATKKTYGVSNELHTGMQIMLFRYIFPGVKKIGVLYSKQYNSQWFNETRNNAGEMGIEIIGRSVSNKGKHDSALKELIPDMDAFWLISDPVIMSDKRIIFEIFKECDIKKMPVFSYHDVFTKYGAVLIVSVDNQTIGRQAAGIAMEVLSGYNETEEKVQFPAGSQITLNLKKVKKYGLQYRKEALDSINRIIE